MVCRTVKFVSLGLLLSMSVSSYAGMLDLFKFFHIVRQKERIIIERLGKYSRTLEPCLQFKMPILEMPRSVYWSGIEGAEGDRHSYKTHRIDLRERVHDLPRQSVITKDNVAMTINALVYYCIQDAKKSVYGFDDLPLGIEKLAQTTLRNIIGSMHLDETLTSRDKINGQLCSTLDGATDKWGVTVTRVELQEVDPPADIQRAMEQQMTAERTRRAEITDAEGKKKSDILRAEGYKSSNILRAEGEAKSILYVAEAQKEAITKIRSAAGDSGNPLSFILGSEYIKILPKITEGKDTKLVVVPYETSALAGMLSTMKNIVKES